MSATSKTCGYAHPGTYGHECGRPAIFAGLQPSTYTKSGIFYAARCADCRQLPGPDNRHITAWEPLADRHVNEWR